MLIGPGGGFTAAGDVLREYGATKASSEEADEQGNPRRGRCQFDSLQIN
jgi:hypothetical protein